MSIKNHLIALLCKTSLYEILMLPTLPNYLSCHIHRSFDGLHNVVWYHLDYFRVLQMLCPIVFFFNELLQMYTCLCIDNRCVRVGIKKFVH